MVLHILFGMKKFAVMDISVEAMPSAWLNSDKSATIWPPFSTPNRFKKPVDHTAEPDESKWKLLAVRFLKTTGKFVCVLDIGYYRNHSSLSFKPVSLTDAKLGHKSILVHMRSKL